MFKIHSKTVLVGIICILAMAFVFTLGGCGGTNNETGDLNGDANEEAAEPKIEYPKSNVQLIVPYSAGGGTDTLARLVAAKVESVLGKPVVVVNKEGAKGEIGHTAILDAKTDGYTVGLLSYPDNTIVSSYKDTTYDNDLFYPLASYTASPTCLFVGPNTSYRTFDEFVAYAKENPGKITVAVSGDTHVLTVLLLQKIAGIEVSTVYFTSSSPVMSAILGGHVDAGLQALQWGMNAEEQGGKLIAVASKDRIDTVGDVPTFNELGYDIEVTIPRVFVVHKDTPQEIKDVLVDAFDEAAKDKELESKISNTGEVYQYMSGADMVEFVEVNNKIIKDLVTENKERFLENEG